ncbi:MAG: hypothetical protein RQ739_10490 [Desulfotignum sp.]|nr:hypothetical protein [Desulfotignum sp.]
MTTKYVSFQDLWGFQKKKPTAANDLDLILPSVISLPLAWWRKNFFFKGMIDDRLAEETHGDFPAIPKKQGTHPVFALKPVLNHIGFVVCPCSSQPQYSKVPWIEKGTRLLHTLKEMDRRSYLITRIQFNMPASVASQLCFQGEVAQSDIISPSRKNKG